MLRRLLRLLLLTSRPVWSYDKSLRLLRWFPLLSLLCLLRLLRLILRRIPHPVLLLLLRILLLLLLLVLHVESRPCKSESSSDSYSSHASPYFHGESFPKEVLGLAVVSFFVFF